MCMMDEDDSKKNNHSYPWEIVHFLIYSNNMLITIVKRVVVKQISMKKIENFKFDLNEE